MATNLKALCTRCNQPKVSFTWEVTTLIDSKMLNLCEDCKTWALSVIFQKDNKLALEIRERAKDVSNFLNNIKK